MLARAQVGARGEEQEAGALWPDRLYRELSRGGSREQTPESRTCAGSHQQG